MKANELMIGDWVLTLDSTHKEKVFAQIDAIEEGQHSILVTREYSNWFVNIDWIEPISLTLEILEKNGFSADYCNDDLSYAQSCGHIIGIHIYGKNGLMDEMYFKYVNQLQQALRLCGIEKEIVL